MRHCIILPFIVLACAGAAPANLVKDGGFEGENPGDVGSRLYVVGSTIGPWQVVAEPGFSPSADADVATFGRHYPFKGHVLSPKDGYVSVDLTGNKNQHTGVAQTLATVPNGIYDVHFWVGTVNDPANQVGPTATVNVYIDGRLLLSATGYAAPARDQVWREFHDVFVAQKAATTIVFANGNLDYSSNNGQCGLDSISVKLLQAPK